MLIRTPGTPNFWLQQMQWPSLIPISGLALALVQYTWMKLSALVVRQTSLTALEVLLSAVLLSSHMQEYDVKVWSDDKIDVAFILKQNISGSTCVLIAYSKCQWKPYLWKC